MFGSNPGMFHYGWYMSPFDARFSRTWFFPYVRTWFYPSFAWYGGWGGRPGFAYGSYWRGAGPGAWGPWPGASGMCGPGSPSSAFFFGAGGFGYGGYPGFGGYQGYGGYSGFGGGYGGYPGFGGYQGYGGIGSAYGGPPETSGTLGLDNGWGHIPESLRNMKGFRVIESRPSTVGADLRRTDPSHLDRWFEELGAGSERVSAGAPDSRDAVADALARGRAADRTSRESISEVIARTRAKAEGAATTPGRPSSRSAPERNRDVKRRASPGSTRATPPNRTAKPVRKPVRKQPSTRAGSTPRTTPASAARSAPKKSSRSTIRPQP
jgi:hypothetical protein